MDKKSKLLFLVFFLVVVSSIGIAYYRYIVLSDYIIQAETDCNPYSEKCFVHVCDSEAGEECTGDLAEDTSYYKLIKRNAKDMPMCDPATEDCGTLTCPVGEADCELIACDPAEESEGTCSDPVVYTEENPIEEEIAEDEEASVEEDMTGEEGVSEDVTTTEKVQGESVEATQESGVAAETEKHEGGI